MNHIKNNLLYKLLSYVYHNFYLKIIFKLEELIYNDKKVSSNKIVIDNFLGKGLGGNLKYIVEALLKVNSNLDIVWEVADKNIKLPVGIRKVKYNSPRALKELLTAKVWIDNVKNSYKPDKRKEQFYLQTWHAGLGLKASEKQIENVLSPKYVAAAKRDAAMTDLMLSDSDWTTDIYQNWFWYNGSISKTGFPRNDVLINQPADMPKKVRSSFGLNEDTKLVLYAPTFRDINSSLDIYKFDFVKIIAALESKFGSDYVVLIKLHPNVANLLNESNLYKFSSRLKNASFYPDMQELIVACDCLITDYSSCMFDAMIAKKKVFLLAKDLDEFEEKDRNLLFDIKKDLPFSFSNDEDELIKNINLFDDKKYKSDIADFSKEVGLYEDGHASERVAKIILKEMAI